MELQYMFTSTNMPLNGIHLPQFTEPSKVFDIINTCLTSQFSSFLMSPLIPPHQSMPI